MQMDLNWSFPTFPSFLIGSLILQSSMIFRAPRCWEDSPFLLAGVFCGWEPAWTLQDVSVQTLGSSRLVLLSWAHITRWAQKCLFWCHVSLRAEQMGTSESSWSSMAQCATCSASYQRPAPSLCPLSTQERDAPSHLGIMQVFGWAVLEKTVNSDVTVVNISFWTGGCEQLGEGPTALRFQESEGCRPHLIFQCSEYNAIFFQNTRKIKCPNEVQFLYSCF